MVSRRGFLAGTAAAGISGFAGCGLLGPNMEVIRDSCTGPSGECTIVFENHGQSGEVRVMVEHRRREEGPIIHTDSKVVYFPGGEKKEVTINAAGPSDAQGYTVGTENV